MIGYMDFRSNYYEVYSIRSMAHHSVDRNYFVILSIIKLVSIKSTHRVGNGQSSVVPGLEIGELNKMLFGHPGCQASSLPLVYYIYGSLSTNVGRCITPCILLSFLAIV